jgi:hypothetical protein
MAELTAAAVWLQVLIKTEDREHHHVASVDITVTLRSPALLLLIPAYPVLSGRVNLGLDNNFVL